MSQNGMKLLRYIAAMVLSLALGASAFVPASSATSQSSPVTFAKKKCKKGKKTKKCPGRKGSSGQKPWAGSGYRPGQVCALSAEMQRKYKKAGLFCLDLGGGIWTLEPL